MNAVLKSLLVSTTLACISTQAQILITQWDFNSSPSDGAPSTGSLSPKTGAGSAGTVGGASSSFVSGTGSSDPASSSDDSGWNIASFAPQGTGNKSRGVQFNVDTTGYDSLIVSWDQRHSNTSSKYVRFQYSLNGTDFVDGPGFQASAGDTWSNGRLVDLSAFAGTSNNPLFAFRVVAEFESSALGSGVDQYMAANPGSIYGTTGTWRFDTVSLTGTAVPEPQAYALLAGIGLTGFVVYRRASQKRRA